MQKLLTFIAIFITIVCCAHLSVRAEDKKLMPEGMYSVDGDINHIFFVGRESRGVRIFEIENGKRKEHKLKESSTTYYDGGTHDLYFENGWQMVIPSRASNYIRFPFGPSLIYPERPRDELHAIEVNKEKLEQYGLTELIDPEFFIPKTKEPRDSWSDKTFFIHHPDKTELLFVDRLEANSEFQDKIKELVTRHPGLVFISERNLFDNPLILFVDPSVVEKITTEVKEIGAPKILHVSSFLVTDVEAQPNEQVEHLIAGIDNKAKSIVDRMRMFYKLRQISPDRLSDQEKKEFFSALQKLTWRLNCLFDRFYQTAHDSEVAKAYNNLSEQERSKLRHYEIADQAALLHPIYLSFAKPIRDMFREVIEYAHSLKSIEGYELVLKNAPLANGIALDLMNSRFKMPAAMKSGAGEEGSYLDFWLNWQRDLLKQRDEITVDHTNQELAENNWRHLMHAGGIFERLGISGSNVFFFKTTEDSPASRLSVTRLEGTPMILLGYENESLVRAAKRAVIRYILEADKIVEKQVQIENQRAPMAEFVESITGPENSDTEMREALKNFYKTRKLTDDIWLALSHGKPISQYGDREATLQQLLWTIELKADENKRFGRSQVRGNELLFQFFNSFRWVPKGLHGSAGFSETRYMANALDIVAELLVAAPTSITSRGVYEFLLETALNLMDSIPVSYAENTPEHEVLRAKRNLIANLVQDKLLLGLRFLGMYKDPRPCAIMLSALPLKALRATEGIKD
jgi:hypothetical protein